MKKYLKIIIPVVIAVIAVVGVIVGISLSSENYNTPENRLEYINKQAPGSEILSETEIAGCVVSAFENADGKFGLASFTSDGGKYKPQIFKYGTRGAYSAFTVASKGDYYFAVYSDNAEVVSATVTVYDKNGNESDFHEQSLQNHDIMLFKLPNKDCKLETVFYDIAGNVVTVD